MAYKGYRVVRIETLPNGAQGTFPVSPWMLRGEATQYGRAAIKRSTREGIRFAVQSRRHKAIYGIPGDTPLHMR